MGVVMLITEDDISVIKDLFYNKKDTQQYKLLSLLFQHKQLSKIPNDERKKLKNIPGLRQQINKILKQENFYLEKITYEIKKIKQKNIQNLILDTKNYFDKTKRTHDLEKIKILNTCTDNHIEYLHHLVSSLNNSNCEIEFATILNKKNENILRKINMVSNKSYFKFFQINSYYVTDIKLFFILIERKNTKRLFYFDKKNSIYIENEILKDDSILYNFLNSIFMTGKSKPLSITAIDKQITVSERNKLLSEIFENIRILQYKSKNKEQTIYKILEYIFQNQSEEELISSSLIEKI